MTIVLLSISIILLSVSCSFAILRPGSCNVVKSRLWLRVLLLLTGAVACCTHVLAVWHRDFDLSAAESRIGLPVSMFALGAIGLTVLLLLNERLASWQRNGQFMVGPGLLAGITIPNMLVSIVLSMMAYGQAFNPDGLGWGMMGYFIFPFFWIIALPITVLIGTIVDWFRRRP